MGEIDQSGNKPEWKVIVNLLAKIDQVLLNRISRRMIYYLYTKNIGEIVDLVNRLESVSRNQDRLGDLYSNIPHPKRDRASLDAFVEEVFKVAGKYLKEKEITEQISKWLAHEKSRFLAIAAESPNISLVDITDALNRFFTIDPEETNVSSSEFINIRVSLIRRFLSDNLQYIVKAKNYVTVRNFSNILKNVIGPAQGTGKLGGKSAGLIVGYEILKKMKDKYPSLRSIRIPKSWFVTSDTTMDFIHYNALEELTSTKYMDVGEVRTVYPFLKQIFKNSFFTAEIVNQLEHVIDNTADRPIIVRSSSLLEDSFSASFSGKYKSLFLSNQGSKKNRLLSLLDAIAEIYASVFSPDPIEYRKECGLLDFNESMAILIQEVVGRRVGKFYFPLFSGVAFSLNEFRWSPRIERNDGVVRLVFGLGTRAVDRIGDDYCHMASPGKPDLRISADPEEILRYSQNKMDLLDLEDNSFKTLPIKDIIKGHLDDIKGFENIFSVYRDRNFTQPSPLLVNYTPEDLVATFRGLMDGKSFLQQMDTMLKVLQDGFGWPVDVEFASDGDFLYFLQCRPQGKGYFGAPPVFPLALPSNRVLFSSNRFVTTGSIKDISHIVYVVPETYSTLPDPDAIKEVAGCISMLNRTLENRKFILIGPGRWGSRGDIKLGVPVAYSDINHTAMLIEIAMKKGDYTPDLSFGTHFFQDLVESCILYLPIYPDETENILKTGLLEKSPNRLKNFAPAFVKYEKVVKVIAVDDLLEGARLSVVMDGEIQKALGYLAMDEDQHLP